MLGGATLPEDIEATLEKMYWSIKNGTLVTMRDVQITICASVRVSVAVHFASRQVLEALDAFQMQFKESI